MSSAREAVRTAYSGRSAEYIDLFGSIDAADDRDRERVERWADGLSPLGVYTLGFLLFWAVVSCASAITALLVVEQDGAPPP